MGIPYQLQSEDGQTIHNAVNNCANEHCICGAMIVCSATVERIYLHAIAAQEFLLQHEL
jgi:hypothetical protein